MIKLDCVCRAASNDCSMVETNRCDLFLRKQSVRRSLKLMIIQDVYYCCCCCCSLLLLMLLLSCQALEINSKVQQGDDGTRPILFDGAASAAAAVPAQSANFVNTSSGLQLHLNKQQQGKKRRKNGKKYTYLNMHRTLAHHHEHRRHHVDHRNQIAESSNLGPPPERQQRPTFEQEVGYHEDSLKEARRRRDRNGYQANVANNNESIKRDKRFPEKAEQKQSHLISAADRATKTNPLPMPGQPQSSRSNLEKADNATTRPRSVSSTVDIGRPLAVQKTDDKALMLPSASKRQTIRAAGTNEDSTASIDDERRQREKAVLPYEAAINPFAAAGPSSGDNQEELFYLYTPLNWFDKNSIAASAEDEQQQHQQQLNKQNSTSANGDDDTDATKQSRGNRNSGNTTKLHKQSTAAAAATVNEAETAANKNNNAKKKLAITKKQYPYEYEARVPFCLGHHQTETIFTWECQGYQLIELPNNLEPKPSSLRLSKTGLEVLPADALYSYSETLRDFSIENAPKLTRIEANSFRNLTKLRVVYIFRAHRLKNFDLAITGKHPDLTIIRIQQTGLTTWPDLSQFQQERILSSIDLDNNQIKTLGSKPINIRAELVNLEFNHLTTIEEYTFNGSEIAVLSLSGNRQLTSIHMNAFANLKNMIKLDLSGTSLSQLPTAGLHQLRSLVIKDNYYMKQIPSIYVFPMLEEAHLTYAHHCCSFRYPQTHDPSAYEEHIHLQEEINAICSKRMHSTPPSSPSPDNIEQSSSNNNNKSTDQRLQKRQVYNDFAYSAQATPMTYFGAAKQQSTTITTSSGDNQPDTEFEGSFDDEHKPLQAGSGGGLRASNDSMTLGGGSNGGFEGNMSSHPIEGQSSLTKQWLLQNIECGELVMKQYATRSIACTPEPDAFNPCEDIMGYSVLRVAVWFVVAASICGNLSVIVVLLGIFNRLSVPKFLQLNLAIGDLVMGVYLALLAVADLTTVGTYFNHAIDWQLGLGCQVAGASSLFASQLSIFTLSVITFERYYTITYSIDLNMRLQLGWAARIMLFGWIYAFASAMLPIFANINSYSKTSICLPLRTIYRLDRVFIIVLLIIDSSAFLIIFVCYLKMYLLILRQKTEATLKERTVAMRMALLVFTDFACWAPIIFFGATAVMGYPLISVTNSKILIVFFYPLNSMANPFLYVISTRQYRRDLNYVLIRWQHWRKNLFKKKVDQTNFYNLVANNPYGLPGHQYPAGLNAHLSAVAAVTGVADHLRHYKLAANHGPAYEHNQLIKLSNGSNNINNGHHHHPPPPNLIDSDSNTQENNNGGVVRIHEQKLGACRGSNAGGGGRIPIGGCQFIIRHQILTSKHSPPGVRIRSTEMTNKSAAKTRRRLVESRQQQQQQHHVPNINKQGNGLMETSEENAESSNVADQNDIVNNNLERNDDKNILETANLEPQQQTAAAASNIDVVVVDTNLQQHQREKHCCTSSVATETRKSRQIGGRKSKNCHHECCKINSSETNVNNNHHQQMRRGKCSAKHHHSNDHNDQLDCRDKSPHPFHGSESKLSRLCRSHHNHHHHHHRKNNTKARQLDPLEATSSSQPEPTTTTTGTSELTTTSADALLPPITFDGNTSMICVCSMDEISSANLEKQQQEQHEQERRQKRNSISDEQVVLSGGNQRSECGQENSGGRHHPHHQHERHKHRTHTCRKRHASRCRTCRTINKCPLVEDDDDNHDKATAINHRSEELLIAINSCPHNHSTSPRAYHHRDLIDCRPKSFHDAMGGNNKHSTSCEPAHSKHREHDHHNHRHHRHRHHHHHRGRPHLHRRERNCDDCGAKQKDGNDKKPQAADGDTSSMKSEVQKDLPHGRNVNDLDENHKSKLKPPPSTSKLMIKTASTASSSLLLHQYSGPSGSTCPSRRLDLCNLKPVIECTNDADESPQQQQQQ